MNKLQWHCYRVAEKLGLAGLLALLLLVLAPIAYWQTSSTTQKRLAEMQAELAQPKAAIQASLENDDSRAARFIQSLPLATQRGQTVDAVMKIADEQQLLLDEINYKTDLQFKDGLQAYHMEFTLIASYPEVQAFLDKVLTKMPSVAIAGLSLSREAPLDDLITARIHLVLYFNGGGV